MATVKVRTGGAKRFDWFNITPVLRHVGITVLKTTKLNVTDDRLTELIALRKGQFVVTRFMRWALILQEDLSTIVPSIMLWIYLLKVLCAAIYMSGSKLDRLKSTIPVCVL